MDLAAGRLEPPPRHGVPDGDDDDAGSDGEDIAAESRVFLLRNLDEPDPEIS